MNQTNNCGMMNQTNNCGMMNQKNNCRMMNQNNKNLENNPNMVKVLLSGNKEKEIIINKKMNSFILYNRLLSIMKSEGIHLYRRPGLKEVIIRNSPNETLEFLLERGFEEKCPEFVIKDKLNNKKEILWIILKI